MHLLVGKRISIEFFGSMFISSSPQRKGKQKRNSRLSSERIDHCRHFRPLNDFFELAVQRCNDELDRTRALVDHDALYMTCALYKQGKTKLKLRLNRRLHQCLDRFDSHEMCLLFQHVNPDTCNDWDLLAKMHQKLKNISLSNDECKNNPMKDR